MTPLRFEKDWLTDLSVTLHHAWFCNWLVGAKEDRYVGNVDIIGKTG